MTTVCGTDFSIHAAEAATVAAILTARVGGTLTLVHACDCAGIDTRSPDAVAALEERGRAQLNAEAERLRKLGATVRTRHLSGSPSSVLLDVAAESKARLMVVSSLGHFPPSRWLVGSVAERLAQNSTIPTLVARGDKPFTAWAAGKRALRVLVGYDFSSSADAREMGRHAQANGPMPNHGGLPGVGAGGELAAGCAGRLGHHGQRG